jgi:hypothetical protein
VKLTSIGLMEAAWAVEPIGVLRFLEPFPYQSLANPPKTWKIWNR